MLFHVFKVKHLNKKTDSYVEINEKFRKLLFWKFQHVDLWTI